MAGLEWASGLPWLGRCLLRAKEGREATQILQKEQQGAFDSFSLLVSAPLIFLTGEEKYSIEGLFPSSFSLRLTQQAKGHC